MSDIYKEEEEERGRRKQHEIKGGGRSRFWIHWDSTFKWWWEITVLGETCASLFLYFFIFRCCCL